MTLGRVSFVGLLLLATSGSSCPVRAAESESAAGFHKNVEPILKQYCSTCHNSVRHNGGVSFDPDDLAPLLQDQTLWLKTLKMLQSGMMPPKEKRHPSAEQLGQVTRWIEYSAFGIDPHNPDPGRVTLHRLNRTEYRNTIRELMGVDFNATLEFPADDTGHGFDTISDVLTLSPLLLEKYVAAARTIVGQAVPTQPWVLAERRLAGQQLVPEGGKASERADGPLVLSYYKATKATCEVPIEHAGHYQVLLDLTANETFVDGQFDYNKCRLTFKAGDRVLLAQEFSRQGGKAYHFEFEQDWTAGKQPLILEIEPLTPKEKQVRTLVLRIQSVTLRGPMTKQYYVRPANYERFFPGTVPEDAKARGVYTRQLLQTFANRAYRRPVDNTTVERLARFAEATAARPGQTFETGIAQAITVVLASPRFLFREEATVPGSTDRYPLLDEYSLASRLSYFLWSSMPDEELLRLAGENRLRQNLDAQVTRMLADSRSGEFVRNFAGQWLQARAIDSANVNAAAVLAKEVKPDPEADAKRARFRELIRKPIETLTEAEKKELDAARASFQQGRRRFAQFELNGQLRQAMRQETEMAFDYVVRNDRSLLELIDADYTFLNQRLARFYEIDGVTGEQMHKVTLPPNSPRGGVLTQGTFLIITSNPDRTSPVKRGLFILDNLLGSPPPPPPPDITPLEQAAANVKGKVPTLRETLAVHRSAPLCSSCHNRMDPLGLAFENFNALGRYRDKELGQPIEAGGELLTGEKFTDVRELKKVLVRDRRLDYYRCATEKMFIYALGRGLEPTDAHTLDELVDKLEAAKGRPSVLIRGIIDSPAFQRRRPTTAMTETQ